MKVGRVDFSLPKINGGLKSTLQNYNHNIIVFKNPKGDLIYFDAQKSKFYNKDFAKNIAYSKYKERTKEWEHIPPKVLRIDDKEFEPKRFDLFSKKSKK